MVGEISGQNQLSDIVNALLELGIVKSIQDFAVGIVQDANGLRQVVTLVHAAFAAVKLSQRAARVHLVRVICASVVQVVTKAGDEKGEALQFPAKLKDLNLILFYIHKTIIGPIKCQRILKIMQISKYLLMKSIGQISMTY